MATPVVYGELDALKRRVDPAGAYTAADNAVALAALTAVSRSIDKWCRVLPGEFAPGAAGVVRYFSAEWADALRVPALAAVTELATDENGTGSYGRVWATTDYILAPFNAAEFDKPFTRVVRNDRSNGSGWAFPVGVQRGVRITGTWGWPEVPADIAEAALIEATRAIQQSRQPNAVVSSPDLGRFVMEPAFMDRTRKLLAPYRRLTVVAVGAPAEGAPYG